MAGIVSTGTFSVTYADGREPSEVKLGTRALIEIERRWPGREADGSDTQPTIEGLFFGVWAALGKPGDFETFIDEVENVEVVEHDDARPSLPVAGDDQ